VWKIIAAETGPISSEKDNGMHGLIIGVANKK